MKKIVFYIRIFNAMCDVCLCLFAIQATAMNQRIEDNQHQHTTYHIPADFKWYTIHLSMCVWCAFYFLDIFIHFFKFFFFNDI